MTAGERYVIAVDASSSMFGIAAGVTSVGVAAAVRCLNERTLERTTRERLWPTLDKIAEGRERVLLVVEEPPESFHDDGTGRAKRQAVIGTRLGISIGLTLAWGHMRTNVETCLLPNGEWRKWAKAQMKAEHFTSDSAVRSEKLSPATARNPLMWPGGGWRITFEGCDHHWDAADFRQLTKRPSTCPTCSPTRAGPTRNEHKAPFVDGAMGRWSVVRAFALELRVPGRADHDTPGVADVCDAAWMLSYALEARKTVDMLLGGA